MDHRWDKRRKNPVGTSEIYVYLISTFVAVTAPESNVTLVTISPRYFKPIEEQKLKVFNP